MQTSKQDPQSVLPYGAQERRAMWPLYVLVALYAVWFGFLVWLALNYPARA